MDADRSYIIVPEGVDVGDHQTVHLRMLEVVSVEGGAAESFSTVSLLAKSHSWNSFVRVSAIRTVLSPSGAWRLKSPQSIAGSSGIEAVWRSVVAGLV